MPETDPILKRLITQAIPEVSCPISNQAVKARRVWLEKKLIEYISNQLSTQFNARQLNGTP